MFSYRHAFHAGNHADVLKHAALVCALRHLTVKETALTILDSHAGAGLYRLDGDFAATSGEAQDGIQRLCQARSATLAPALLDYLDCVAAFNAPAHQQAPVVYPGSPFLFHRFMRGGDTLKLFELHPGDARFLHGNVAQLQAGRRITVLREDGFAGVRRFLPPPSRRALLLCDPSYEIKTDYRKVPELVAWGLERFATGCYVVWHPVIARAEAHELPRRLKTLAVQGGRAWLHATLTVKSGRNASGLPASGVFFINPPWPLKAALAQALPQLVELLAQDKTAAFTLDGGEGRA